MRLSNHPAPMVCLHQRPAIKVLYMSSYTNIAIAMMQKLVNLGQTVVLKSSPR